jgi:hypothetical protein
MAIWPPEPLSPPIALLPPADQLPPEPGLTAPPLRSLPPDMSADILVEEEHPATIAARRSIRRSTRILMV